MGRRSFPDLVAAVAVAALLLAATASAQDPAQTSPEQQRLRALEQRATDRLATLQREADALAGQQRGLLQQLRALEVKRDLTTAEVARLAVSIRRAEADLAQLDARHASTQRALDAKRPAVQTRLAALYTSGSAGELRRWLAADTLSDAAAAERLLAAVAARDRRELEAFLALRAELAAQREALDRQRRSLEADRVAAVKAQEDAARAAASHDALVRQIDERRDLASQLSSELESARLALQQQIEGLADDPGAPSALPFAPFKGVLPWPADGRVTGAFGRRATSRFGTATPRNGIELAAPAGAPVRAVHDGRVAYAGEFAGLGRLVIVDHGRGAFSLYGYLDEVVVSRGTDVDRGATLGHAGRAPSGQPMLYFELRVDGRPANPLEWLKPR